MHFLLDLHWMIPGQAGGVENISRSLLNELMVRDLPDDFWIWLRRPCLKTISWGSNPRFHPLCIDLLWMRILERLYLYTNALTRNSYPDWIPDLMQWTKTPKIDAVLSMPGYIHPQLLAQPNLLFIADIQHEYYPDFFTAEDLEVLRHRTAVSTHSARHICTLSQFTKNCLVERLSIAPEHITTLYPSVDPAFYPESPHRGRAKNVLTKYNLPLSRYIFFPGHTWPHKNHVLALKVLSLLRKEYHLDLSLVCTGSPRRAQADISTLTAHLQLEKFVRFLGYCPSEDMPALYEGAATLFFPSLFEGFGIPLLEAMWCGCPVVCSRSGSLPEIAGPAARFVDPLTPESAAHALFEVLTSESIRQNLIQAGLQQVHRFSWNSFTDGILRLLHQIAKE